MIDSEDRIINIPIENEMRTAYIDYSMSVIVSRALPDARDGFKPVHRRVLYAMNDTGNVYSSPHKKSAKTVGEVIAKYHPHGDSSVYFTLVRLAQPWNMRYTMVDGQGNFGSIDGDSPAAMRYTEARLSKIAAEMLRDIEKETVDFQNNFDDTIQEPTVLPTRIPNLLINGAAGIAVGMATNMPPHNLTECIDGCIAYIDKDGEIDIDELMQYITAPDFPTGGTIYGYEGVKEAFRTGRGRIVLRAKCEIEETATHQQIIVHEIPYQVVKSDLVSNIAQLVNEKKIDGISDIRDESNRKGLRIVIEIKRDANAAVVLNKLYKMTALQSSFSVNNIALVGGRPMLLNLKDLIREFVDHRHDVVTRRCEFELRKAQERAHILEGLLIAVDNIDEVINIIRAAKDPNEAQTNLINRFALSDIQARAIVDMRLRALTGLERDKLRDEYEELERTINRLEELLASREERMKVVKEELLEIREKYGDERRTNIVYNAREFNAEDFYADEDMIITISHMGYIKRTPLTEFHTQNRGGVGAKGSDTRSEDFVEHIYSASMHATMLLFTAKGQCYWLKVYEIPEGSKNAKGRAIQNLLPIDPDDKVTAYIRVKDLKRDGEFVKSHYLVFATKKGTIKKNLLNDYSNVRTNGIIAIKLAEDDQVVSVRLTNGKSHILMATKAGYAIRFPESKLRVMKGRNSSGVKGINLGDNPNNEVVGMIAVKDAQTQSILVVSENGYGKRTSVDDYRITNRGGKGVKTMNITDKTGYLIDLRVVNEDSDLMIIKKSGVAIRISVKDISLIGRYTQGVKLVNLEKKNDAIASVCSVAAEEQEQFENDDDLEGEMDDPDLEDEFVDEELPEDEDIIEEDEVDSEEE